MTLGSSAVFASFLAARIVEWEIDSLVEPVFVYLASLPVLQFMLFLAIAYTCGLLRVPVTPLAVTLAAPTGDAQRWAV